ncbi:MAG: hypothetical protein WCP03_03800 [Candidatus Saccharibacteria bacterium]
MKCGYSTQPEEATQYNPELPPELQGSTNARAYMPDPNANSYPPTTPMATPVYTYTAPLESYLEAAPTQSDISPSAAVLSKLASVSPKQKKIALAALSLIFIVFLLGGFFGYNDYQTTKTLKQGISQNDQGKFDEAKDTLNKAKKGIAYPGTKKAVDKEITNNKRWKEYSVWQTQAEDLINGKQFAAALELLYKINNDYPLYGEVQSLITIAEAGGVKPSYISSVAVEGTPITPSSSATTTSGGKIVSYTPWPSSNTGGGTTPITPLRPGTPIVRPTPTPYIPPIAQPTPTPYTPPIIVIPPPITPTPIPQYVYKNDGTTVIGQFIGYEGGSACYNIVYSVAGIRKNMRLEDCYIPVVSVYFTTTNCTGTKYTVDYAPFPYNVATAVYWQHNIYARSSITTGAMTTRSYIDFIDTSMYCVQSVDSGNWKTLTGPYSPLCNKDGSVISGNVMAPCQIK